MGGKSTGDDFVPLNYKVLETYQAFGIKTQRVCHDATFEKPIS